MQGELLTNPGEVIERWSQYCGELYNKKADTSEDSLIEIEQRIAPTDNEEPLIIRSEIKETLNKLKSNKAPGTDNIPAELLKNGGDIMIDRSV